MKVQKIRDGDDDCLEIYYLHSTGEVVGVDPFIYGGGGEGGGEGGIGGTALILHTPRIAKSRDLGQKCFPLFLVQ